MISALIIDDELKNISTLNSLLRQYCQQVHIAGHATSAANGKLIIEKEKPDLVFLDIEMPYGSGFDLLRSMPHIQAEIIFVTAFDQYAINAFRFSALDYLLKPINIDQLERAVRRAEGRIAEKTTVRNYEALLRNIDEKDPDRQVLTLTDKGHNFFVRFSDIKYIIADGSYTHIYTDKRSFVSTKNLKDYETMLPDSLFCRIHHGHIINRKHIVKVKNGRGGIVYMTDGKVLEISVRKKEEFLKMYRQ